MTADNPRTCGGCTACCKLLGISDMKPERKPPNVWCQHCKIGEGCGIYHERPLSCRAFECQWLMAGRKPEYAKAGLFADSMRPDRSKVMLVPNIEGDTLIAHVDPATPFAWRKAVVLDALRKVASEQKRPCFAWAGRRCWAIMPDGSEQRVPEDQIVRDADGHVHIAMKSQRYMATAPGAAVMADPQVFRTTGRRRHRRKGA